MKLVVVQVDESVDISALTKGTNITLNDGVTNYAGVVSFPIDSLDPVPPTIEGDYHITQLEEA